MQTRLISLLKPWKINWRHCDIIRIPFHSDTVDFLFGLFYLKWLIELHYQSWFVLVSKYQNIYRGRDKINFYL